MPFDFVDLRMRSSDKLQAHRLFTSFCTLVNSTHMGRLACERDDQKAASTCLKGSGCLARHCHLGLSCYLPRHCLPRYHASWQREGQGL